MPESSKILSPTWLKNRSWTSFWSHLEPLGVSEMDSQCIFRPDWARQSSERPQNGPKINRFPLIVPEWLKRNTQYYYYRKYRKNYTKTSIKYGSFQVYLRSCKAYFFKSGPSFFDFFKIGPKPSRKYSQTIPKSHPNHPKSVPKFSNISKIIVIFSECLQLPKFGKP